MGAVRGLLHLKGLGTLKVHQAVGKDAWQYDKLTALTSLANCTIRQHAPTIDVSVFGSKVRWCLPCSGCVWHACTVMHASALHVWWVDSWLAAARLQVQHPQKLPAALSLNLLACLPCILLRYRCGPTTTF